MKKIFILLAVLAALFSFSACEPPEEVAKVFLIVEKRVIEVGEELEYKVTTLPEGENAPDYTIYCPDSTVLSMDENNVITGRVPGRALVYVLMNDTGMSSIPVLIEVVPKTEYAEKIKITGPEGWNDTVYVQGKIGLGVEMEPENSVDGILWSSSDESVVSVQRLTGEITGLQEGKATITAVSNVSSDVRGEIVVTCKPVPAPTFIALLNPVHELFVPAGTPIEIRAEVHPAGALQEFTISPADSSTVEIKGHTVIPKEDTYIYVQAGDKEITVELKVADWLCYFPEKMYVGDKIDLYADELDGFCPEFRTEDPGIAYVEDHNLVGMSAKKTTVYAVYPNGMQIEHEISFVERPELKKVEMDPSPVTIGRHQRMDIDVNLEPADADPSVIEWGGAMAPFGHFNSEDRCFILNFYWDPFTRECGDYDLTLTWNGATQKKTISIVDVVFGIQGMKDACGYVEDKGRVVFGGRFDIDYGESGFDCKTILTDYLQNITIADMSHITNDTGFDFPLSRVNEIILPRRFRENNIEVTNSANTDCKITYNEKVY